VESGSERSSNVVEDIFLLSFFTDSTLKFASAGPISRRLEWPTDLNE
jgi:hypothetical protein